MRMPARPRAGAATSAREPQVGDRDQALAAVEQRDAPAHPRHDAGVVEPTLERLAVRPVERPEVLAAGAEAQLEPGVEPRLGQAPAPEAASSSSSSPSGPDQP